MLYKVLRWDRSSCIKGYTYPEIGKFTDIIKGPLQFCSNGYHLCSERDLLQWILWAGSFSRYLKIFEAVPNPSFPGYCLVGDDKFCFKSVGLVRRVAPIDVLKLIKAYQEGRLDHLNVEVADIVLSSPFHRKRLTASKPLKVGTKVNISLTTSRGDDEIFETGGGVEVDRAVNLITCYGRLS